MREWEFRLFESDGMLPVELPTIPGASLAGLNIANDESRIAFYATSGKMPRDLFYYDSTTHPGSSQGR